MVEVQVDWIVEGAPTPGTPIPWIYFYSIDLIGLEQSSTTPPRDTGTVTYHITAIRDEITRSEYLILLGIDVLRHMDANGGSPFRGSPAIPSPV